MKPLSQEIMSNRHKWSDLDMLTAFYVEKYGTEHIGFSKPEIGRRLGMGASSFPARVANIRDARIGGQSKYGAREIWTIEQYDKMGERELRGMVLEHLRGVK